MLVKVRCTLNLIWRKSNLSPDRKAVLWSSEFHLKTFLNLFSIACSPHISWCCCSVCFCVRNSYRHLWAEEKGKTYWKWLIHVHTFKWIFDAWKMRENLSLSHWGKAIKIIIYIHIKFEIKNCLSSIRRYLWEGEKECFERDFCEKHYLNINNAHLFTSDENFICEFYFFLVEGIHFWKVLFFPKAFSSFFMEVWEKQVIVFGKNGKTFRK